jgi:hypothetical protein
VEPHEKAVGDMSFKPQVHSRGRRTNPGSHVS